MLYNVCGPVQCMNIPKKKIVHVLYMYMYMYNVHVYVNCNIWSIFIVVWKFRRRRFAICFPICHSNAPGAAIAVIIEEEATRQLGTRRDGG